MASRSIPKPICIVVGEIVGQHYFNHQRIASVFAEAGAPGDPPEGNCVHKATEWLKRTNDEHPHPLHVLGQILEPIMEVEPPDTFVPVHNDWAERKGRIAKVLANHGLEYVMGGEVMVIGGSLPTRSLAELLRARDLSALEMEFERAVATLQTDPPAAVTAACAILETACTIVLEDEGQPLPKERTVSPLWKAAQKHLHLDPAQMEDSDLKSILGGLSAIVHGIGAFRSHAGSAHGGGRTRYRAGERHARLAINAAHTLVSFILETWDARKARPS